MEMISKEKLDFIPMSYEIGQIFYYEVTVSVKGTNIRMNNTDFMQKDEEATYSATFTILRENEVSYFIHLTYYIMQEVEIKTPSAGGWEQENKTSPGLNVSI